MQVAFRSCSRKCLVVFHTDYNIILYSESRSMPYIRKTCYSHQLSRWLGETEQNKVWHTGKRVNFWIFPGNWPLICFWHFVSSNSICYFYINLLFLAMHMLLTLRCYFSHFIQDRQDMDDNNYHQVLKSYYTKST